MGLKAICMITPSEFDKVRVKDAYEAVLQDWRESAPELGYYAASPVGRGYFGWDMTSDSMEASKRISQRLGGELWYVEIVSSAWDSAFRIDNGIIVEGHATGEEYVERYPNTTLCEDEPWRKFPELVEDGMFAREFLEDDAFWEEHEYEVLVTPRTLRPWWKFW